MTNIPYTYEVTEADENGTVLVYRSPGRPDLAKGVHTPREGETLDGVAAMYAPIGEWLDMERARVVPQVGASGSYTPPADPANEPMTLERAKAEKLAELAAARYEREVGGITIGGARIKTDRESQATITGAFISLSQGLAQTIDWKAEGGQWVTLNLAQIQPIAQAVVAHVQACFTAEGQLAAEVAAASTIEAVQAIEFPTIVAPGA